MPVELTRRELLGAGAATAAALYGLRPSQALHDALAAPPRCGHLTDIDYLVIFIQENRSFDHYFGTHRGVRGSVDTAGRDAFSRPGYAAPGSGITVVPFPCDGSVHGT